MELGKLANFTASKISSKCFPYFIVTTLIPGCEILFQGLFDSKDWIQMDRIVIHVFQFTTHPEMGHQ